MIVATGNINSDYRVIGVVHVVIVRTRTKGGCGTKGDLPVQEAYEAATSALAEAAKRSGGNGIINISYDYRQAAVKFGCGEAEPTFEVYGWGTVISTTVQ